VLAGDHIYKMDYSIMLADHVESGRGVTVGCIEVSREEAKGFGVMAINEQRHIVQFVEKPADPPAMPDNPDLALASMGIYVFSADYLYRLLEEDAADPESDHDFGKNLIPKAVSEGQALAHPFSMSAIANPPYSRPYWRDVGTVDAYWAANLDLASTTPELNMYDSRTGRSGPTRSSCRRRSSCTMKMAAAARPSTRWCRAAASCPVRRCATRCCFPTCWCARTARSTRQWCCRTCRSAAAAGSPRW
jgi:ADP-glucose pyrophosphorylase